LSEADCTALLDCEQSCSDSTCAASCESAHPTGAAKLAALSTCANDTCGAACSAVDGSGGSGSGSGGGTRGDDAGAGGGGAPASCGLTSGDVTCDACLDGSCCSQTESCLGDAECVALIECYDACSDDACAAACDTAHPSGKTGLGAVMTCVQSSCASACGL
jgi:hypothetical protein